MQYISSIYEKHFKFIILFFFLNYFTVGWQLLDQGDAAIAIYYAFTAFLASFLLTMLINTIPYKPVQRVIKAFLIIINLLPCIAETYIMHTYNILINAGMVCALLETTTREAMEYLKMYITVPDILCLIFSVAVLIYISRIKLQQIPWLRNVHMSHHTRNAVMLTPLIIGIFSTGMMLAFNINFFYGKFLPLQRVASATEVAIQNRDAYEKLMAQVKKNNVKITANNSKIPNIVFILGEATNRNHMHLYGYYLPTTPNLDKLKAEGKIAVFTDVISAHSTTIASLSKVFTFCDHESKKPWYDYNNLIDVMNAAGYKTYWLSNQESSGIWGNVAAVYAAHSTEHAYTKIRDSHEDYGVVDGNLFPLIDKAISRRKAKNFYVIHLMGCHGLYYYRYPYYFSKFSDKNIRLPLTTRQKEIVAQYDNAILYNDYVVSQIIAKFRNMNALVIYMPDHSEAIYDEGDKLAGHFEGNPNRHMIEIPFIIWGSEKYKKDNPAQWAQIQACVNRPYMTDDMIHTVMDIAGIKTPEYDPTRSIVNPKFNAKRPRIFNNKNYDTEIRPRQK